MADTYINELEINGQKRLDLTQDTATPETVLEGKTFHLRSGAPAVGTYRPSDEIEARLRATVGHSSKNLLKIEADSRTINGVTFTVNKTAGTITVNGQVSSSATMAQLDIVSRRDVDSSLNGLILTEPASKTIPNYGFRTAIAYYNSSGTYISEQVTNSGNPNPVKISIPSNAATYKIYIRATTSAGTLNNLVVTPMLREAVISDDTFEPYVTPTDEAKQDKPVMLYDAGESFVGVHSVTGLSNLTQYSELHITLFAPLSGDESSIGYTQTIVYPFIFPNDPDNAAAMFDCWVTTVESGAILHRRTGMELIASDTNVQISGELTETGNLIDIPSNHYIYIKRIVGIP